MLLLKMYLQNQESNTKVHQTGRIPCPQSEGDTTQQRKCEQKCSVSDQHLATQSLVKKIFRFSAGVQHSTAPTEKNRASLRLVTFICVLNHFEQHYFFLSLPEACQFFTSFLQCSELLPKTFFFFMFTSLDYITLKDRTAPQGLRHVSHLQHV